MSLVREIMDGAIDSQIDISTVLRKCKVLAARLKSTEFAEWIDRELNGYPNKDTLPEYRVVHVSAKAHLVDQWGRTQLPNAGVMSSLIPENLRHWATTAYLMAPISAYASLLPGDESGQLSIEWPQELAVKFGATGYSDDLKCLSARQVIARGSVVALVETVRNRIVDFALRIEEAAPDAGEAAPGETPVPKEVVNQIFHTYVVSGGVNNIASAGLNVNQSSSGDSVAGDLSTLLDRLRGLGISLSSVDELGQELTVTRNVEEQQSAAQRWLGKLAMVTASGSVNALIGLAAKAIATHLGLGPPS